MTVDPKTRSASDDLWIVIMVAQPEAPSRALRSEVRTRTESPGIVSARAVARQAVERARLAVSLERIVIVAARDQEKELTAEFRATPRPRLLIQPEDRGAAAGVLLPTHWIRQQDPYAIVALFPSDHLAFQPVGFMELVARMARLIERDSRAIVALGARTRHPDPAARPGQTARSEPTHEVSQACFEAGCFWSTSMTIARADTLADAGRRLLPELSTALETVASLVGTTYERRALEECYAVAPRARFPVAVSMRRPRPPSATENGLGRDSGAIDAGRRSQPSAGSKPIPRETGLVSQATEASL